MLIIASLDHRHSSVAERERFMFPPEAQARLGRLVHRSGGQLLLLATCNRVELITEIGNASAADGWARLVGAATRIVPVLSADFLARAECHFGTDAIRHLYRVASGLESQIPGDVQILGQLRAAYERAIAWGTAGAELHRVVQGALRTAKGVHTRTAIGKRSATVGAAAAEQMMGWLADNLGESSHRSAPSVVVVGAGKTAERAAERLASLGCTITICNRNAVRAASLAASAGGVVAPFEDRHRVAASADAILVTTAAPEPMITAETLQRAREESRRSERPLLVVDLGVPRNVDAAVARLRDVTLLGLQQVRHEEEAISTAQWQLADALVEAEVVALSSWLGAREARRERVA